MPPVTVRVPAKVNLQLSVGPRRPDGYHDLATVFCALSLHDELTASVAEGLRVSVTGRYAAGVPGGAANLAIRAARLLAEEAGVPARVHLHVDKGIPVAGGMAGGSADAAAALLACDALWGTACSPRQLHDLAARLGSDVPFALLGGAAVGLGRGERLDPVPVAGRFEWVLALAGAGLSTPAVYAECDRLRGDRPVPAPAPDEALLDALRTGDAGGLGRALGNDLQPAALGLRPELAGVMAAGRRAGALGCVVSGSGPTVAFLAADAGHAEALAAGLRRAGVAGVVRAHGPVGGAALLAPTGSVGGGRR